MNLVKPSVHKSGTHENMPRKSTRDREMIGGCCVCSDERGWDENPLVYCDGQGCNVAVHQACYGIVQVPTGPWFCRKCESQERAARVRCELCPSREGALKRTDTNSWAHVVCALYIPEVRFGNVSTMEPIILGLVPQERYLKVCYLCEQNGREGKATSGACMQCNKSGCKQTFHVTCAQSAGLLCEEAGNYQDNVKYCGYCDYHYQRIVRNKSNSSSTGKIIKTIPAYRPIPSGNLSSSPDASPEKKASEIGNNPVHSPAASPDRRSGSSKKGRRPNSAASDLSDGHSKSSNNPDHQKVPNNHQDQDQLNSSIGGQQNRSPTSANTSSTSASSSSKQSSTSSLTDATSSSSPEPAPPTPNLIVKAHPALNTASASEDKPAPVIVKLAKADGVYYNKKDEKKYHKKDSVDSATTPNSFNSFNEDVKNVHSKVDIENGKDAPSSSSSVVVTSVPLVTSLASSNSKSSSVSMTTSTPTSSASSSTDNNGLHKSDLKVTSSTSMSGVSVSLTSMSSSSSSAADYSKKSSAYDFTIDKDDNIPPMPRKDSPAKIIPINGGSSGAGPAAGKPLKIETSTNIEISAGGNGNSASLTSPATIKGLPSPNKSNSSTTARFSKTGKRIGRPPKKGTLLPNSSLGSMSSSSSEVKRPNSPPSSPEAADEFGAKRRKTSPSKRLTNGSGGNDNTAMMWMMGTSLNSSSSAAREMDMVLKSEIAAHAAYDPNSRSNSLHGVSVPGKKKRSNSSTTSQSNEAKSAQPQTLEELLERQWEQGSQFLMEQASHFDIASLLSSLHQLKEENVDLKDSVDRCVQRRDHLLAVRARLMALNNLSATNTPTNSNNANASNAAGSTPGAQASASSTGNTPERTANGPSPASASGGRNSAHVSPRNSAATVSPIRVDRSGSRMLDSVAMVSPRLTHQMHAPPPPAPPPHSVAASLANPPLPPPAHSPRDSRLHLPSPRSSPRGFPMENGDYLPVSNSVSQGSLSRSHQLLTVVSSSSGSHPAAHHGHGGHGGHGHGGHSLPRPPPRQSSYAMPPTSMHPHMQRQPPPSHSHGGLPPPPRGPILGRPPMPHAFPGGVPPGYVMERGINRGIHEKR